jgi:phage pi2 protein 07
MKRIISLAMAATILIANAEEEEAAKISREVYSRALLRMAERNRKSLRLLHQYIEEPKMRKSVAELYSNILHYPQVQASIESANLEKVKELCQEKSGEKFIDKLSESLRIQAAQEREKIKSMYELLCRLYKIEKEVFKPTELYERAASLKPKRLFKGPLPWSYAQENLSQEDFEHYQKNVVKIGGRFDSSRFEIINLMNGKRTLLDIRHIISCEYDETGVEYILHFVEDLKKMGLVEF